VKDGAEGVIVQAAERKNRGAVMQIFAQINLYPLKAGKALFHNQKGLEDFGRKRLVFQKGSMSTVVTGKAEDVFSRIYGY